MTITEQLGSARESDWREALADFEGVPEWPRAGHVLRVIPLAQEDKSTKHSLE